MSKENYDEAVHHFELAFEALARHLFEAERDEILDGLPYRDYIRYYAEIGDKYGMNFDFPTSFIDEFIDSDLRDLIYSVAVRKLWPHTEDQNYETQALLSPEQAVASQLAIELEFSLQFAQKGRVKSLKQEERRRKKREKVIQLIKAGYDLFKDTYGRIPKNPTELLRFLCPESDPTIGTRKEKIKPIPSLPSHNEVAALLRENKHAGPPYALKYQINT